MDLIVNSLYSTKEIFLRELVSNASDALDKMRFESLTSGESAGNLEVKIKGDKEAGTLVIEDNGIGMSHDELVDALGTIARSGTAKYMETLKESGKEGDSNLIGQFGVGFYSSFLVAETVTVESRAASGGDVWQWQSAAGEHGYKVKKVQLEDLPRGTRITLKLKEEAAEFAEPQRLSGLVKTYSEFISFPISVWSEEQVPRQEVDAEATKAAKEAAAKKAEENPEEEPEEVKDVMKTVFDTVQEFKVQNDNKPLWVRPPREVKKEEYDAFYKATFKDFMDPAAYTHFNVEGDIEFQAILFTPAMAPFDQQEPNAKSRNIKLFVKRVFISDDFGEDLMPRYMSFIKGVVDSSDLPLNVSREILQEGRVVRVMRRRLVKKALDMMKDLAAVEDPAAYNAFYDAFGRNLKLGVIEDEANRAALGDLLRFSTSASGDSIASLKEYVGRMKEGQSGIYFLAAASKEAAEKSPFIEGLLKKGLEVVYLLEPIDEVALTNLKEYEGTTLLDVTKEDLELSEDEGEKEAQEQVTKELEPLTSWMAKILGDKVEKVVVSQRLGESPCMLATSKFGWSANMERIMRAQAMGDTKAYEYMKGRKIMEINPSSPIIKSLASKVSAPDAVAESQVQLMFDTAMLTSGFLIEDPAEFASRIFSMMSSTAESTTKSTEKKSDEKSDAVDPEVMSDDPWN